ncbi:unnamed protein product, partial [Owenia fusiformis]
MEKALDKALDKNSKEFHFQKFGEKLTFYPYVSMKIFTNILLRKVTHGKGPGQGTRQKFPGNSFSKILRIDKNHQIKSPPIKSNGSQIKAIYSTCNIVAKIGILKVLFFFVLL